MKAVLPFLFPIMAATSFGHAQNVGIGTNAPQEKLQVAGKIYTSEGGIKFPDQTVQTTAAYNNNTPEQAALPHGIGFIKFTGTGLKGPIDTLTLIDVSLLYSFDFETEAIPPGGGGGGSPTFLHGPVKLVKQIDNISPNLYKYLLNQTGTSTATVYLTRFNSSGNLEVAYEIVLTNVICSLYSPALFPGGGPEYANTERLELSYSTITVRHLPSNTCYCWNRATNMACGC